jgi:hypothetical protein
MKFYEDPLVKPVSMCLLLHMTRILDIVYISVITGIYIYSAFWRNKLPFCRHLFRLYVMEIMCIHFYTSLSSLCRQGYYGFFHTFSVLGQHLLYDLAHTERQGKILPWVEWKFLLFCLHEVRSVTSRPLVTDVWLRLLKRLKIIKSLLFYAILWRGDNNS